MSNPVRVAPQQERSVRRLAGFLDAAAELFVEVVGSPGTELEFAL